jgi:hypothetical protein
MTRVAARFVKQSVTSRVEFEPSVYGEDAMARRRVF